MHFARFSSFILKQFLCVFHLLARQIIDKCQSSTYIQNCDVYLFVCLGFFVTLQNFTLVWRRHQYRWRATNFYPYSALMAIEHWGFFSVLHLVWHGPTLSNGHLRGPVTLTPVAERLAVELSLTVLTTDVCPDLGSNPDLPHARWTLYHYGTVAWNIANRSSNYWVFYFLDR